MNKNQIFINKCVKIHGDVIYAYKKVNYINAKTKVIIECVIHGDFSVIPNNFLNGSNCIKCSNLSKKPKMDTDRFIEKCNNLGLDLSFELNKVIYTHSKENIKIVCKKHGEFETTPDNFITSKHGGCRKCRYENSSITQSSTTKEFIDKCHALELSDRFCFNKVRYVNSRNKVIIICKKHGDFKIRPTNFIEYNSCPNCHTISKGENLIAKILQSINVKYNRQHYFENCRGIKNPLPFDFYLPDYNICIEYDGVQHFEPISAFGGIDAFNILKNNDFIKNKFCKINDIVLIRIPYYDRDNLYKILSNITRT